jgi:catalase
MTSRLHDKHEPVYTLAEGAPVHDPTASVQLRTHNGGGGLGLLQDTQLIECVQASVYEPHV